MPEEMKVPLVATVIHIMLSSGLRVKLPRLPEFENGLVIKIDYEHPRTIIGCQYNRQGHSKG